MSNIIIVPLPISARRSEPSVDEALADAVADALPFLEDNCHKKAMQKALDAYRKEEDMTWLDLIGAIVFAIIILFLGITFIALAMPLLGKWLHFIGAS